eukprot:jgi/Tetstr1/462609/TSEL_007594.t1
MQSDEALLTLPEGPPQTRSSSALVRHSEKYGNPGNAPSNGSRQHSITAPAGQHSVRTSTLHSRRGSNNGGRSTPGRPLPLERVPSGQIGDTAHGETGAGRDINSARGEEMAALLPGAT